MINLSKKDPVEEKFPQEDLSKVNNDKLDMAYENKLQVINFINLNTPLEVQGTIKGVNSKRVRYYRISKYIKHAKDSIKDMLLFSGIIPTISLMDKYIQCDINVPKFDGFDISHTFSDDGCIKFHITKISYGNNKDEENLGISITFKIPKYIPEKIIDNCKTSNGYEIFIPCKCKLQLFGQYIQRKTKVIDRGTILLNLKYLDPE